MASSASTPRVTTRHPQTQRLRRNLVARRFWSSSSRTSSRQTRFPKTSLVVPRNEWDNSTLNATLRATTATNDVLDFWTLTNTKATSRTPISMSPIQLQDVARKQFEDRERRRAQQVRLGDTRLFPVASDSAFFLSFLPQRVSLQTNIDVVSPPYVRQTTTGGRPAARLSLGPLPTSESRKNALQ